MTAVRAVLKSTCQLVLEMQHRFMFVREEVVSNWSVMAKYNSEQSRENCALDPHYPHPFCFVLQMQSKFIFGRVMGASNINRSMTTKYTLPKRLYIGPTFMDNETAFQVPVCNMA